MHDYQKGNHITARCMDNSIYLYDSIKMRPAYVFTQDYLSS